MRRAVGNLRHDRIPQCLEGLHDEKVEEGHSREFLRRISSGPQHRASRGQRRWQIDPSPADRGYGISRSRTHQTPGFRFLSSQFRGFQGKSLRRAKTAALLLASTASSIKSVERFVEEFAEIGKYFDMPIATYSSGMRSRISFGLSMAIDFDVYLVDEALSVGDGIFKARADALFQAKAKQANLIIVSHSPATVRKYCDMGAVMSNGQLVIFDQARRCGEALRGHHAETSATSNRRCDEMPRRLRKRSVKDHPRASSLTECAAPAVKERPRNALPPSTRAEPTELRIGQDREGPPR